VSGADRERLLERLRSDAYRAGTFTLASGKTSDFFIDCKKVMLTAEGHALAGASLTDAVNEYERATGTRFDNVAGVALGGCPLASAVAIVSFQRGRGLDALYVRKEAKDHGTKALVEGAARPGARVALLEDVLTTGGSSRAAIERLREAGFVVDAVFALVDRREGAVAHLAEHGVKVTALFAREDFVK
jgi:orotate phosphoribosyltransferase